MRFTTKKVEDDEKRLRQQNRGQLRCESLEPRQLLTTWFVDADMASGFRDELGGCNSGFAGSVSQRHGG